MARRTPRDVVMLYGDDIAYVHDAGFGAFCESATPFLRALVSARGPRQRVVEVGCGGGRLAEVLAADGHDVFGVDVSPAMIRMARARVPSGRFVCGSILDVDLPRADVVLAVSEVFNYPQVPRALPRIFRRIRASLSTGGDFAFDLAQPNRPPENRTVAQIDDDFTIFAHVHEDAKRRTITRDITTFVRRGSSYRRRDERHVQRLYESADVARWLRAAGFSVRVRRGYGDFVFGRNLRAFVARAR